MACVVLPGLGIVCTRGVRQQRCKTPGCGATAGTLCDWPTGPSWATHLLITARRTGITFRDVLVAVVRVPAGTPEVLALRDGLGEDLALAKVWLGLLEDGTALPWTKTCSASVCDRCAVRLGPDKDLCPPHGRVWRGEEIAR